MLQSVFYSSSLTRDIDTFLAKEQEMEERLPICRCCGEHIQQEYALQDENGEYVCDECATENEEDEYLRVAIW